MATRNITGTVAGTRPITIAVLDAQVNDSGNILPPYQLTAKPGVISVPLELYDETVTVRVSFDGNPSREYEFQVNKTGGAITLANIVTENVPAP